MHHDAENAVNLLSDRYRDADGYWYGIATSGIMGFFYNTEILEEKGLEAPKDWDHLIKPEYKGLIWFSEPQHRLHLQAVPERYRADVGSGESRAAGPAGPGRQHRASTLSRAAPPRTSVAGECAIGIGFLHDAGYQVVERL